MRKPERGATITPSPEGVICEAVDCNETELLARVEPDGQGEPRTLCPHHRVEYLREVYYE